MKYQVRSWFIVISVFFVIQLIGHGVWFYREYSFKFWVLFQFLMGGWLILTALKFLIRESPTNRTTLVEDPASMMGAGNESGSIINVDQLIGSMAHEVRKPLNRLNLKLDQVKSNHNLQEDIQELEEIIDRVEAVFRGQKPQKRWISTPRFFRKIHDSLDISSLAFQIETDWIYTAPDSLKDVLKNLIKNSREAYADDDGPITVSVKQVGPEFCFTVEDEAGGIDSSIARQINRDESKNSQGMGLGLLLCQKIMKNIDGRMVIETTHGKGTIVTLTIPVPGEPLGDDSQR